MSGDLQVRDRPRTQSPLPPPIDPRIAARWISVRHDHNRRRRRIGVAALAAVTAVVGLWILARSPLVAVRQVAVHGTGHTNGSAVILAAGLDRRSPLLAVDLAAVRRRVEALPWVASAGVRRQWPSTVTITVTERTPLAQVNATAGQVALVDAGGRVLAVGPPGEFVAFRGNNGRSLPAVRGIPAAGAAGTALAPQAEGALTLLRDLQVALRSAVPAFPSSATPPSAPAFTLTSVALSGDGTLTASLAPGDIEVVFGSTDRLAAKLVALRSVLAQVVPGDGATIDVRVAEVPVLTDGAKSSSLSTTQRG